MKVLLQRNLFLGGNRYRRDPYGTELPDYVDGRKVVIFEERLIGDETIVMLPKDAVPYEKPDVVRHDDPIKGGRTKPIALSKLTPKPTKTVDEV